MEEKKCNCNQPYDAEYFQGGYPYCPVHDKPQYYPGSSYQNLFDYLHNEHGLTLLESEMNDLINVVHKFHPAGAVWVKASINRPDGWQLVRIIISNKRFPVKFSPNVIADIAGKTYEPQELEYLSDESGAPAAAREEDAVEKLKSSLDYYRGMIAGLGDSETDDFNRSVYFQHSGDLYTAIKIIEKYEKYFNELFNQQKEK